MSFENCCRPEPSFPLLDLRTTRLCSRCYTLSRCTACHRSLCPITDTSLCQCRWLPSSTLSRTDSTVNRCRPKLRPNRTYRPQMSPRPFHAETFPTASTALRVSSSTLEAQDRLSTRQDKDPLDRDLSRATRVTKDSSQCLTLTRLSNLRARTNSLNHLLLPTRHLYPSPDPSPMPMPLSMNPNRISPSLLSMSSPRRPHLSSLTA